MSFNASPEDDCTPVSDLGSFRVRRRHRLPAEAVAELHRAERLCEELHDAGVELRFDEPGAGARIRAVLVDTEGHEIREVSLTEVVELDLGPLTG